MTINLNISKAVQYLLTEEYWSEFEIIDNVEQHRDGLNFNDWLLRKGLISKAEHERLTKLIRGVE